ncbi:MAG: S-layer homology domain-containing protein [Clostridia bacterium]|nr:S-layer homology domain-containing protein [Clostridia bacterium]
MKKVVSVILATTMLLSGAVHARKSSIIGFSDNYQSEINRTTGAEISLWQDAFRGCAVVNPNFTKKSGVVLNTDFGVPANVYVKIRYYITGEVNKSSNSILEISGKEYQLFDYSDKALDCWHTDIVYLENIRNPKEMTFIPVNNSESWTSNADIYIDYIGFFETREQAEAFNEGDDDDNDIIAAKRTVVTASGSGITISGSEYLAGYTDKYFRPDYGVSRAEAGAMISRVITAEVSEEPLLISDVKEGDWYYEDIKKLADNGIIQSEGSFEPTKPLTRRALAVMLWNLGVLKPSKVNQFTDIDISDENYDIICAAANSGIMVGDKNGAFMPEETVTRAQMAAVLNRVLMVDISAAAEKVNPYSDVSWQHWAYLDILASTSASLSEGEDSVQGPIAVDGVKFDAFNSKNSVWEPVMLRNQEIKDAGHIGGEGAQYQTYITVDKTGNNLATFSDAGQIFISKDGGATWVRGGKNMEAHTLSTGEFDPNNSNRIIGCTLNGTPFRTGQAAFDYTGSGIYLSEDMGTSFEMVMTYCDEQVKRRVSFAWDATSYDAKIDGSSICYFTTNVKQLTDPKYINANATYVERGFNQGPGLYRSMDGGYTWELINDKFGGAAPAVCPANGYVFIADVDGLFRSRDKGETWEKISDVKTGGVTTIFTYPENVYVCDEKGLLVSTDGGEKFNRITSGSYPNANTDCIKVSPANPDRMAVAYNPSTINSVGLYFSHDGGASWFADEYDESLDFYSHQPRWSVAAWHPTDENKVWAFSDWVESSSDGGRTFKWDANGQGSTCVQAPIIPNVYNPNIWMVTAQDYGGAVTFDNGDTFIQIHGTPGWDAKEVHGGHTYGGYAVDENTWFLCCTGSWEAKKQNLIMTFDAGKTWEFKGETNGFRTQNCFQSPVDPNVLFATDLRSDDGGKNWQKMPFDIKHVAAFNPEGPELFAFSQDVMYISTDTGATWDKLFDAPDYDGPTNLNELLVATYDHENDILYFAQADSISKYQNGTITKLNCDLIKNKWVTTLNVDPTHPNVIYACGTPNGADGFNDYKYTRGIIRSCDYGETWQCIASDVTEDTVVPEGPCVGIIPVWGAFVHPETGYFVIGQPNWGVAKFPPPYEK